MAKEITTQVKARFGGSDYFRSSTMYRVAVSFADGGECVYHFDTWRDYNGAFEWLTSEPGVLAASGTEIASPAKFKEKK
jgi:hypothetical protein